MPPIGPVNPQQGSTEPDDNGGHGLRDWDDDEVEDSVMNMSSEGKFFSLDSGTYMKAHYLLRLRWRRRSHSVNPE